MLSATDIHRWLDGSEFMGERLVVQFARGGNRPREGYDAPRMAPRPRRTVHRMTITGLPFETSWQVGSTIYAWV
jgi:transcription initiation factor TFIID subunit 15